MKTLLLRTLTCAVVCAFIATSCSKNSNSSARSGASPGITAIYPTHGPDSSAVMIAGSGFGASASDNAVFFNGKQANIVSASDTLIVARVPSLAGTGAVTVATGGKTLSSGTPFTYDTAYRLSTLLDNMQGPMYISMDANGVLYVPEYGGYKADVFNTQSGITSLPVNFGTGTVVD